MLVLGRRLRERLRITTPEGIVIWISVGAIDGGRVRVGIDAPRNCLILREELVPPAERKVRPHDAGGG